ncbi:MAG: carbon storage regulator [Gemmataceae bacterium]
MLVVSRKQGEELIIPELNVTVSLLEVRNDQVRVGVSAPPDVLIYRRELWERIQGRSGPPPEEDPINAAVDSPSPTQSPSSRHEK